MKCIQDVFSFSTGETHHDVGFLGLAVREAAFLLRRSSELLNIAKLLFIKRYKVIFSLHWHKE